MRRIRESEYFKLDIITAALCLLPILIGLAFYSQLPEQVAIHFNAKNQADGFASREFAIVGMPLLLTVVQLISCIALEVDPKRANASRKMQVLSRLLIPFTSFLVQTAVILFALNKKMDLSMVITLFMGAILLLIGNFLPKCKYNYTIGIKIPTTLASEENWNKTHRLAGFVWVAGGLAMIALSVLKMYQFCWCVFVVCFGIPTIYSFLYAFRAKTQK